MTDTIRTRLDALSEAATPAPWTVNAFHDFVAVLSFKTKPPSPRVVFRTGNAPGYALQRCETDFYADATFIVALVNAYARGELIPRDEVEGLIEAMVSAAEAADIDTQLDYGNGDDLSTWLVQRCNLDALRVAKNAAADYLSAISTDDARGNPDE